MVFKHIWWHGYLVNKGKLETHTIMYNKRDDNIYLFGLPPNYVLRHIVSRLRPEADESHI